MEPILGVSKQDLINNKDFCFLYKGILGVEPAGRPVYQLTEDLEYVMSFDAVKQLRLLNYTTEFRIAYMNYCLSVFYLAEKFMESFNEKLKVTSSDNHVVWLRKESRLMRTNGESSCEFLFSLYPGCTHPNVGTLNAQTADYTLSIKPYEPHDPEFLYKQSIAELPVVCLGASRKMLMDKARWKEFPFKLKDFNPTTIQKIISAL